MITINSLTIRSLNKIYRAFSGFYEDSITKKVHDFITKPLAKNFSTSKTKVVIAGEKPLFRDTLIYKIYREIFNLIEKFMNLLGKIFLPLIKKSFFLGATFKSLDNFDEIAGIISNIMFYTGIFTLIISLIIRASIIFPLAFIILGIILSLLKGKYMDIIMGSKVLEFFISFFKLDEGGENWW
ncbi:hypothetical protein [Peptoniphilus senegalensis]|uniref:ABC transmembrane type-1 domain-containing protein n=1 Tax=Peptoniphilus senegalensis TaxID=1465757 RepID=A0ABV1J2A0_9FIRM|nr:hypothetical protein PEPTYR26121_01208 [Peptoniphilus tyrrelliae]